jgi:hypothetical protein
MKKFFKRGVRNPLDFKKANFKYEVLEPGVVTSEEYEEAGRVKTYPVQPMLIKEIGGKYSMCNKFYCTAILGDAMRYLRKGDIISANLQFDVKKDQQGVYQQTVSISDICTLNDYCQLLEEPVPYLESTIFDPNAN